MLAGMAGPNFDLYQIFHDSPATWLLLDTSYNMLHAVVVHQPTLDPQSNLYVVHTVCPGCITHLSFHLMLLRAV